RSQAGYFLVLAERDDPRLRGHHERAWFLRLEREHANLRAALRWLLSQDAPAERALALRLAGALGWFWFARGYHAEGRRWLEEALERVPKAAAGAELADPTAAAGDAAARTPALLHVGRILMQQGDVERARAELEEALAMARRRHDHADVAWALTHLGARAVYAREWAEAARLLRAALARSEQLGERYYGGTALYLLGAA